MTSRRIKFLLVVAAILWPSLLCCSGAFAQQSKIGNLTGQAKRGKELYGRYCMGCHGPRGDGEGENAAYLNPKPRDFTMGLFKCRSTPSGSIPLDSDLFDTVGRGVDTTGMPRWFPLTPQERADLVAYVKTFSGRGGKAGQACRDCLRNTGYAREHPARQRSVSIPEMLRVPRRKGTRRWSFGLLASRQQGEPNRSLRFHYWNTLQVRGIRSRPLSYFHDRTGRNTDAVVC
jgi:hypothetical protein